MFKISLNFFRIFLSFFFQNFTKYYSKLILFFTSQFGRKKTNDLVLSNENKQDPSVFCSRESGGISGLFFRSVPTIVMFSRNALWNNNCSSFVQVV